MNIVTANHIKQHGVSVIEEHLKAGPVHVFKHSRPLFVIISEEEYQRLTAPKCELFGLSALMNKKVSGKRSKQEIDQELKKERDDWND